MASIKDVAQRAGVSTATVSRMMANKGYISEETRERVQAAIDELDYRPNRVAQRLREAGLAFSPLSSRISRTRFSGSFRGRWKPSPTPRSGRIYLQHGRGPGQGKPLSGTDAAGESRGRHYLPYPQALTPLKKLQRMKIPVVTVDRQVSRDFDSVLIDNTEAARHLTERVLAAGYERVAGISGPTALPPTSARRALSRP